MLFARGAHAWAACVCVILTLQAQRPTPSRQKYRQRGCLRGDPSGRAGPEHGVGSVRGWASWAPVLLHQPTLTSLACSFEVLGSLPSRWGSQTCPCSLSVRNRPPLASCHRARLPRHLVLTRRVFAWFPRLPALASAVGLTSRWALPFQNAQACPGRPPGRPEPSPPLESLAPVAFALPLLRLPAPGNVALHIPCHCCLYLRVAL